MNSELIANIANVALALSVIVALIFGVAQVRAAARDRRERLTLESLRNFQTREFAELIAYITTHDVPPNFQSLQKLPPNEQVYFIQFAQEMESLGILVAERFIDLDLVDKTLGTLVTSAFEKYRPMFEDTRVNQPDPFIGEYFQWLAERIEERMRENPRKPFYQTKKYPSAHR